MNSDNTFEHLVLILVPGLIILGVVMTVGAELAALVFGGHHALPFSPGATLSSLFHPGDPRAAWPVKVRSDVPSAFPFWLTVGCVLLAVAVGVFLIWGRLSNLWTRLTTFDGTLRREDDAQSTVHQLSSATALKEIKRLRPNRQADHKWARSEGLMIGRRGHQEMVANWEDSILIIGPPRSGKSTSLVSPWIVESPGPVVTTSTRPDVARMTTPIRKNVGPVVAFDPLGITDSVADVMKLRWNPIIGCERPEVALRRANAMASSIDMGTTSNGDFWRATGAEHLAYMLHAAALCGASPRELLSWVGTPKQMIIPARVLMQAPNAAVGWGDRLNATATSPAAQTTGSILAVVSSALAPLNHPRIYETCSADEPIPTEDLLRSKATIHLLSRMDQANAASLICALLTDLIAEARDIAAKNPNGRLEPPFSVLLDEAANIAPIPDLPALLATGGGESITVAVVFQSLAQARGRWGEPGANAILDASTIVIVLPGLTQEADLKALAALAGEVRETHRSKTIAAGGGSTTIDYRSRPALEPSELRELPAGSAYVLPRRFAPTIVKLVPVWNRPWSHLTKAV